MALIIINTSLAATIYRELSPSHDTSRLLTPTEETAIAVSSPDTLPNPDFDLSPLAFYDVIVARPLFTKTRRPPVETDNSDAPAQPGSPPPTFVLMGVAISPEETKALLLVNNKKEIIHAAVGEHIEGWKVVEIQPNQVQLSKGLKSIDVLLERIPNKHSNWPVIPAKPRFIPQPAHK